MAVILVSIGTTGQLVIAVQLYIHIAVALDFHGSVGAGFDVGIFQGDVGLAALFYIHRDGVGSLLTVAGDGHFAVLILLFLVLTLFYIVRTVLVNADIDAAIFQVIASCKRRSRHGRNNREGSCRGQNTQS